MRTQKESYETCMMATRRTSPRRPTAMEPMAMAAGPSANLSTRPSAAKLGPHASTFSCCAMNSPAASRDANENDMIRKLSVSNQSLYAAGRVNLADTFHFLLVTRYYSMQSAYRIYAVRLFIFLVVLCWRLSNRIIPVYLGDYYIPCSIMLAIIE